ncbi:MAG: Ppx/GppA family phosphatase [Actinobacteria bacterium]|nr:MAG: Ppx/GppA family phosphatase [Actinomycetota bacterium]
MTRVAAVDLGTNSTRLLVADVEDGRVEELDRETVITRLGEGVDRRRRLLPEPIARVRNCLTDFRRRAEELGAERTLLVATSAVRDAENGEAFLGEIEWSYGFDTELLSGEEEAAMTLRGVSVGRELEPGTLLLDVGGGSTELTLPDFRVSLDVGSVRLTERFLGSDPPTDDELAACRAAVRSALDEHAAGLEVRHAIGVAGTITTIAALELGGYDRDRVHGYRIAREAAERRLERLAALPLEERRELPGLEPARAPVIVAGVAIVAEVLRFFGLDELEVSEQDILTGAALAAAELPEREEGDAPPGAYTCC